MFNFFMSTLITLLVCGKTGWTTTQERFEEKVALNSVSGYTAPVCSDFTDYPPTDTDVATMGTHSPHK